MYHSYFGKLGQLRFPKPEDYYRFLGYLAHADIKVVYEYNEDTGSWGNAGRICFYTSRVPLNWGKIAYREGRGDSMWYRINCNDFVENIVTDHAFTYGDSQDVDAIRETIPANYLQFFDERVQLVIFDKITPIYLEVSENVHIHAPFLAKAMIKQAYHCSSGLTKTFIFMHLFSPRQ